MGWDFEQVLFTIGKIVGPGHVHQLMVEKNLHVIQGFLDLKQKHIFDLQKQVHSLMFQACVTIHSLLIGTLNILNAPFVP